MKWKNKFYTVSTISILILYGCNAGTENKNVETIAAEEAAPEKFELVASTDKNFPIKIPVLNKANTDSTTNIKFNDANGKLEVGCGKNFNYQVSEMVIDLVQKKQQLESGIFKVTYNSNLPDQIVYRSELPDGSNAYYHFISIKLIDEKSYVFEDNPAYQFSLSDVNTMVEAIQKADK